MLLEVLGLLVLVMAELAGLVPVMEALAVLLLVELVIMVLDDLVGTEMDG
ncbi:MAG: hypothetical protein FWD03_03115 [Defluviitaleaceae bacterium]|nr:hypothetical protein [Defluviitaleaceae bacterium]